MRPDIRHNTVPLLRTPAVAVRVGLGQNLRLEFIDSVENRHPTLFDRLDAQAEVRAKFSVVCASKIRSQELLFRGTQPEYRRLVTVHRSGNGIRRVKSALAGHNGQ